MLHNAARLDTRRAAVAGGHLGQERRARALQPGRAASRAGAAAGAPADTVSAVRAALTPAAVRLVLGHLGPLRRGADTPAALMHRPSRGEARLVVLAGRALAPARPTRAAAPEEEVSAALVRSRAAHAASGPRP